MGDTDAEMLKDARRLIAIRKAQDQYFCIDIFRDIPWSIMLILFVGRYEQENLSVKAISDQISCSYDTSERYCRALQREGILVLDQVPDNDSSGLRAALTDSSFDCMKTIIRSNGIDAETV
jgi:hypothetical protein